MLSTYQENSVRDIDSFLRWQDFVFELRHAPIYDTSRELNR